MEQTGKQRRGEGGGGGGRVSLRSNLHCTRWRVFKARQGQALALAPRNAVQIPKPLHQACPDRRTPTCSRNEGSGIIVFLILNSR